MTQLHIFQPFFAMMFLTLAVWLFMFTVRIRFLTSGSAGSVDLSKPGELARISPAEISNPSDNLKNLFELPVLFYAIVLYLYATNSVDGIHVACAWVFAVFRMLHSFVHCTFNHVMLRFYLYLIAAIGLWTMVVRAALA